MPTEANLIDMFADIEIDMSDYEEVWKDLSEEELFAKRLSENPNSIVLFRTLSIAFHEDNDKESRGYKAWTNLLRLLLIEFLRDPYWNSRLGWMMWAWVCYAKYDSYYPMAWCFHYDPLNWYREDEPNRPPELEKPLPYDPFNIRGGVVVSPDWYKRKEDGASNDTVQ